MVRLRKLLDRGFEVTFLPGGDLAGDGTQTYEVMVTAIDGDERAAYGPTPQSALLNVTRIEPGGRMVTFAATPAGGWFADMREEDGRIVATGAGRSHAEALAQLRERVQADSPGAEADEPEPCCGSCGAQIGIFHGRESWHHFRGAGTVESPVELFDAGHEPTLAWRDRGTIFDSARTCDQMNPATGEWCHRGGEHGEHRDANGDTWPTAARDAG